MASSKRARTPSSASLRASNPGHLSNLQNLIARRSPTRSPSSSSRTTAVCWLGSRAYAPRMTTTTIRTPTTGHHTTKRLSREDFRLRPRPRVASETRKRTRTRTRTGTTPNRSSATAPRGSTWGRCFVTTSRDSPASTSIQPRRHRGQDFPRVQLTIREPSPTFELKVSFAMSVPMNRRLRLSRRRPRFDSW